MLNILIDPIYYCFLWTGAKTNDGYGLTPEGKLAHREAYEEENGPIPKGMQVEHRCRRRNCVYPTHLELVSQSVNSLRKQWSYRVQMQNCQYGHPRKKYGLITPEGGQVCRECR